jgi:CheY-like chemotaxis protein
MMKKRILVVEDQVDNRRILRDLPTNADYEIIEAENGEEALAAAAAPARPIPHGHSAADLVGWGQPWAPIRGQRPRRLTGCSG